MRPNCANSVTLLHSRPERTASAAPTTLERWPAGSTRSRTRRAGSARRRPRSTSRRAWPRPASARSSSTSTRRRTRPPGSGMRANGTSSYDLLDGAPLAELAKPTAFPNLFLVPSKPELAGAAVELSQRARRRPVPRRGAGGRERLRLRPARLPALARPADRERARGRRPRDRAGAGRVLRARGARAARALDQPRPRAAQPAARDRRRADHDERRPHEALRRRRGARCAATSATSSSTRSSRASVRVAEAPSHGLPVTALRPALARRRGLLEGGDGACRTQLRPAARPRPRLRGPDRRLGRARARARAGRADPREPAPAAARFDHEATAGLADSIRTQGVIQPVVLRPRARGRLRADRRRAPLARRARGGHRRPCRRVIREADDRDTLLLGLVENVARENLSPIEEARGYALLMDEFELSLGEVSERVGRSKPAISNKTAPARAARRRARDGRARRALRGPRARGARRSGPGRAPPARAQDRRAGPVGASRRARRALVGRPHEAAHEDAGRPGARRAGQGEPADA